MREQKKVSNFRGVYFREDIGKWYVNIRRKGVNVTFKSTSKTKAEQFYIKTIAEIENGTYIKEDTNISLVEAVQTYLDQHVKTMCKTSTQKTYQGFINNYLKPYFKERKLNSITKNDMELFKQYLKESEVLNAKANKDK